MTDFKHIALVANIQLPEIIDSLKRLITFLTQSGYQVLLEQKTAELVGDSQLPVFDSDSLETSVDLIIVVGGDGSMLSAVRSLVRYDIPLLGVNRGRLGFLTDILPDEMESQMKRVLAGEYIVSSRFLLDVSISRKGAVIGAGAALNDVVLHPGKSVRMMEFELYIDGQFVYSQCSDGLIVSTPTGSTAYALSGGRSCIPIWMRLFWCR